MKQHDTTSDTFPRQYARTNRLTLGAPRDLSLDPVGGDVLFLRSGNASDPVHHLWRADLGTGEAQLIVDTRALLAAADDGAELSDHERARRERLRESAGGVTAYSIDRARERVVFALAGRVFTTTLGEQPDTIEIDVDGPVFDPHISPDGTLVGYVSGRDLVVVDLDGFERCRLGEPDAPLVTWGAADFVAAEEMRRLRGFWWSPDSSSVAVCRTDESPVNVWYIADAATPARPAAEHRYPAAGTANPLVDLFVADIASGSTTQVMWNSHEFEYLPRVEWNTHGLTITVQSRDQRRVEVLDVDAATGTTSTIWADRDERWVELVPGSPTRTRFGLVVAADRDGARRLLVDGRAVTPADLQVRAIVYADDERVVLLANPLDDPTVQHVVEYRPTNDELITLADGDVVATAVAAGDLTAIRRASLDGLDAGWTLPSGALLASVSEVPLVTPNVTLLPDLTCSVAVLLPHDHDGSPLPVLLDPYGGPHAQRVVRSYAAMCPSQWFADQGFAVVVADGRGTPGRGSAFERAVHHDLASGVLDDQIDALDAAAARFPLDLDRVAIRGWSFGGYLAALAALRRPDRVHAAIAGAPVTEWRLYDTHYTERYLGNPNDHPDVYDANSLLPLAERLERPLLLIHGLADDNVVAAHTLQLSSALLAAGRAHEVLPLVGVTHMTPQAVVAENLLLHQLGFLRRSLGLTTVGRDG